MPNPPYEATPLDRRQVEAMAGYGIPQPAIARVLGISVDTLQKYFRDELDVGAIKANAKVAESLFKKATSDSLGSVTAAIFWLKVRCGWKEPPVTIDQTLQILDKRASEMTNDELVSLIARATQHLEGQARPEGELH